MPGELTSSARGGAVERVSRSGGPPRSASRPRHHAARGAAVRAALRGLAVAVAVLASRGAGLAVCVGDCDGGGQVAINELILGVTIALGTAPPSACPAFQSAQGQVGIAQLIQGVNNALGGCPPDDGLLSGPPGGRALDAVRDEFSPDAYVRPEELSGPLVRTQVELAFRKDATVDAVNDLLRRIDARIVGSRRGVAILVVRIPDPGNSAALDQVLAGLAADPLVRLANRVAMPHPNELPDTIHIDEGDTALVRNHLAVRAHAAWNARAALAGATRPTLVLGDYFGGGPPDAMLYGPVGHPSDFAIGTGSIPDEHGYHVLGIAAGTFDTIGTISFADADSVTGMFPGALPLRAADCTPGLGKAALRVLMLMLVRDTPRNVVLNTSLATVCDTPEEAATFCNREAASEDALLWIEQVRGSDWPEDQSHDLEGKFLHATAAGNVEGAGPLGADVSSDWNAATLIGPLFDPATHAPVPNLGNTLVVENFVASMDEPYEPDCISPDSEQGGNIAAIGTRVFSFTGPRTTGIKSGTSMATPQVAGLAAYVWALRPDLSPAELVALLQRTALPTPGCGNGLIIDAYAAVLAADEGNPDQPVRSAILDVADGSGNEIPNGAVDEHDLDRFLMHIDFPDPEPLDYGRYDLNGDGSTGSGVPGGSDRVDLDADGAYGLASVDVEGLPVRFDEEVPTDLKVLCYFAYSPLYTGDPQARRERLGLTRCLKFDLEALFPATVQPGVSNLLSVRVTDLDLADVATGEALGQAGVHIELTVSGGTVDDFIGTTNADGIFQTNARLFAGQPGLAIEVIARAGEGGAELARTAVLARATVPSGVTRISSRGSIGVAVNNVPGCADPVHSSPAEAMAWSDTLSCNGSQNGNQAAGTVTASFTESYAGSDLVEVTASSSGPVTAAGSGTAEAGGSYELKFTVAGTTTVSIDAHVTGGDNTGRSPSGFSGGVFFGGDGPLIHDLDGSVDVTETLTLSEGEYVFVISSLPFAGGSVLSNSGSFSLHLTFGP